MKMQNLSKLTLAVLVTAQLLNLEGALAANVIQTNKTNNKMALEDPRLELHFSSATELTDEEALEFNEPVTSISNRKLNKNLKVINKNLIANDLIDPPVKPKPVIGGNQIIPPIQLPPVGETAATPGAQFENVIMVIDKLIAVGQKVVAIIKEGKSVVTNNPMAAISVLPRSELADPVVHDMGGWSYPVSKHYKIVYKNGFGSEVLSFVYSVSFQYNGSTNGKGHYLAGVRASARKIDVSWGTDLDASSQLIQISNVGSQANVIAGATLEMTYTVKNWARSITTSESFHVTGTGKLIKLD
jgi:hypothetical protein